MSFRSQLRSESSACVSLHNSSPIKCVAYRRASADSADTKTVSHAEGEALTSRPCSFEYTRNVTPSPARRSSRRKLAPFRPISAALMAESPIGTSASYMRLPPVAPNAAAAERGVQTGKLNSTLVSRTARCSASLYAAMATRALQLRADVSRSWRMPRWAQRDMPALRTRGGD